MFYMPFRLPDDVANLKKLDENCPGKVWIQPRIQNLFLNQPLEGGWLWKPYGTTIRDVIRVPVDLQEPLAKKTDKILNGPGHAKFGVKEMDLKLGDVALPIHEHLH
jgi:hypothetical protein